MAIDSTACDRISSALCKQLEQLPLAQLDTASLSAESASMWNSVLAGLPLTPATAEVNTGTQEVLAGLLSASPAFKESVQAAETAASTALLPGDNDFVEFELPLGLAEFVLSLQEQGNVLGLFWSGCYRTRELSVQDMEQAQSRYGLPSSGLDALAALPIQSAADIERSKAQLHNQAHAVVAIWELWNQVTELDEEVRSAERTRALGTLSGGVAHHFNNLLSVILGYSSHLLNRLDLPESAHEALLQISEAAQRGRRLTEQVLAFAGSESEEEVACSVHTMIKSLAPLLESQAAGRLRIVCELNAADDRVRSQRSVLHQTLYNLLVNSIDGLSESGGELGVTTDNLQRREEDHVLSYIRICVTDTGDATSESQTELLLALDQEPLAPPPTPRPPKKLASHRIWVVDDDPIFCEMCQRVLGDDGHDVTSIASGPVLQKEYAETQQPPNLLIIDFSMPDYNGLELCKWLRAEGCRAPVILVSGFSHTHPDIHKALKMRKTFFLQKPFPVPELADIVSVALGETLLGS